MYNVFCPGGGQDMFSLKENKIYSRIRRAMYVNLYVCAFCKLMCVCLFFACRCGFVFLVLDPWCCIHGDTDS